MRQVCETFTQTQSRGLPHVRFPFFPSLSHSVCLSGSFSKLNSLSIQGGCCSANTTIFTLGDYIYIYNNIISRAFRIPTPSFPKKARAHVPKITPENQSEKNHPISHILTQKSQLHTENEKESDREHGEQQLPPTRRGEAMGTYDACRTKGQRQPASGVAREAFSSLLLNHSHRSTRHKRNAATPLLLLLRRIRRRRQQQQQQHCSPLTLYK